MPSNPKMTPEVRRGIIRWCVKAAIGLVGYALIIFLSAGTVSWVWGWALIAVLAAFMAAHPLLLVPINPELLAEREKGALAEDVKPWDKRITRLMGALMLLSWIVAGFDFRFQWSGSLPLAVHVTGLAFAILGYAIFLWAMASNAFFSEGVRIQTERGHTVATGGPYRFVRHPGYLGAILSHLATPLLLGSLWALIPAVLLAALLVLRTSLEDKMLLKELAGYEVYAQHTRYRLLSGVW